MKTKPKELKTVYKLMFLSAHGRQKQKLMRSLNKRKAFVEPTFFIINSAVYQPFNFLAVLYCPRSITVLYHCLVAMAIFVAKGNAPGSKRPTFKRKISAFWTLFPENSGIK